MRSETRVCYHCTVCKRSLLSLRNLKLESAITVRSDTRNIYAYTHMHTYIYVYMRIDIYAHTHVRVCAYRHTHIDTYTHTYMYMHVCVYICICIYVISFFHNDCASTSPHHCSEGMLDTTRCVTCGSS